MWAYLENWIVQDGEVPDLGPGATLRAGLRAQASQVRTSTTSPEGITELSAADADGRGFRYTVTGVAGAGTRVESFFRGPGMETPPHLIGTEFLITAGAHQFLALAPPDAAAIGVGSRVSIDCIFLIMAKHEIEELALPDVRGEWRVAELKLEQRRIARSATGIGGVAEVIQVRDLDRMRRWDDDPDPDISVSYLLDLISLDAG